MSRGKINHDSKLVIRISKEQREKISKWAKENGKSVSAITRQYYETLTNGGNQ